MTTSIVLTTIAAPSPRVLDTCGRASREGWRVAVAGDRRTPAWAPDASYAFLPLEAQRALPFRLPALLPVDSYARKNAGYLAAIHGGATWIVDLDDDNFPREGFWRAPTRSVSGLDVRADGWVNTHPHFGSAASWPRGIPLPFIGRAAQGEGPARERDCPIQQGLADGDPDVDAIYRLARGTEVRFQDAPPLLLGGRTWAPLNSQNTRWHRVAFPLLYIPSTCSFRSCDIWRGLVAVRIARAHGWLIAHTGADVWQDRNPHDLRKDFEQEMPVYTLTLDLAARLDALPLEGRGLLDQLRACYGAFAEAGAVTADELPRLEAWCADCVTLGLA